MKLHSVTLCHGEYNDSTALNAGIVWCLLFHCNGYCGSDCVAYFEILHQY